MFLYRRALSRCINGDLKMKNLNWILGLLFVVSVPVHSNVLSELQELEKNKASSSVITETPQPKSSIWGDHQVDNYQLIFFMQNGCGVCKRFDPVFKSYIDEVGINAVAYTLDGRGDSSFPHASTPPQNVIQALFLNSGIAMGTPTIFMLNVKTLKAYPITNGEAEISAIHRRIIEMMLVDEKENIHES